MGILNYSTSISADKTIGEIQKIISTKGASKIMIDYEEGKPVQLSFQIMNNGFAVSYRLPANWKGVLSAINKSKVPTKFKNNEQAHRTCWRIIKDWVEAQVAIIEAGQSDLATVFLPYAIMANNETVAKNFLDKKSEQLLLTP